jgi:predicted DNA binding CopG/RHH family protein
METKIHNQDQKNVKRINIVITPEQLEKLESAATKEGLLVCQYVRRIALLKSNEVTAQ